VRISLSFISYLSLPVGSCTNVCKLTVSI